MMSVDLRVASAPLEARGLKGEWTFPEADWDVFVLKRVNRCRTAGTQMTTLWHSVLLGD